MKFHFILLAITSIVFLNCEKCPEPDCKADLNNGLLAYYPFNGNSNDESGNGNNGTIKNGAYFTTDFLGRQNKAAGFDGINDYILVQDNGKLNTDKITISMMLQVNNINRRHAFLARQKFENATNSSWALAQSLDLTNNFDFAVTGPSVNCSQQITYDESNAISAAQAVQSNRWFHLLATFENGEQKIYIDGVLKATKNRNFSMLLACPSSELIIGGWWQNDIISIDGKL